MARRETRDGREILGGAELEARRREVWLAAGKRCQCELDCPWHRGRKCRKLLALNGKMAEQTGLQVMNWHHLNGRGMGGSKRSDAMKDTVALCGPCHPANDQLRSLKSKAEA